MEENTEISIIFVPDNDDSAARYAGGHFAREIKIPFSTFGPSPKGLKVTISKLCDEIVKQVNAGRIQRRNTKQSDEENNDRLMSEDEDTTGALTRHDITLITVVDGLINHIWSDMEAKITSDQLPTSIDKQGSTALCAYMITGSKDIIPVAFSKEKEKSSYSFGAKNKKQELVSFPLLLHFEDSRKKQVFYKHIRQTIDKQIFPRFKAAANIDSMFMQPNIQFDIAYTEDMKNIKRVNEIQEQDAEIINMANFVGGDNICLLAEFNNQSADAYQRAMKIILSEGSKKKQQNNAANATLNTIEKCVKQFLIEEELEEEDAWYCPKCQAHQQASKKFDLYKLPPVLTIQLKRFGSQRFAYSGRKKVKTKIEFPIDNFKLADFVTGPIDNKSPPTYSLVGVSNHMGEMGFGHYTAYGRNVLNDTWYNFDDQSVRQASEEEICSPAAYVLVYIRHDVWTEWREKASID